MVIKKPWLIWLSKVAGLTPVRAHAQDVGFIPSRGCAGQSQSLMSYSHIDDSFSNSLSLPLSLKVAKNIVFKKDGERGELKIAIKNKMKSRYCHVKEKGTLVEDHLDLRIEQ